MSMVNSRLMLYSLTHFMVDFCCGLLLFSHLSLGAEFGLCLLLYNFCAFAMQMPLGLLADGFDRNGCVAAVGCVLVAVAWGLVGVPLLCATVLGLGNALFHVGGGLEVLNFSGNRSAPLGIFVSPGAFGVYFGALLGSDGGVFPGEIAVICIVLTALILVAGDWALRGGVVSNNPPVSLTISRDIIIFALIPLFLVVCGRSYLGVVLNFPWKGNEHWAFILVCGTVLGKALGGYLGDRLGMSRACVLSLGASALLFSMANIPILGCLRCSCSICPCR